MAISFWNLLGQAALIDWIFGKRKRPAAVEQPRPPIDYVAQEKRMAALEDKLFAMQSRIDEMQDLIDERLDEDSDEYFDLDRRIDDMQFDAYVIEDEVERLRDEIDDDFDYD